jgi:periplasmic divalent cation tolerance protein
MPQSSDCEVVSVATTVGAMDAARELARQILEARLAACVQLDHGVTSHFRWQGELSEEPEVRLLIKTLPECVPALQALFAGTHPYDLPQFLVTPAQASPAYAAWVRSEVVVPGSTPP